MILGLSKILKWHLGKVKKQIKDGTEWNMIEWMCEWADRLYGMMPHSTVKTDGNYGCTYVRVNVCMPNRKNVLQLNRKALTGFSYLPIRT